MATPSETTEFDYIIHNIFLPPELPQSGNADLESEDALMKITLEALKTLKQHIPQDAKHLDIAINMIANSRLAHGTDGMVVEEKLLKLLSELGEQGHPIFLHIRAQNAGVLITSMQHAIHFEAFELSPQNSAVYATHGRLKRSFPACTVAIDRTEWASAGLQAAVAHTLAQMSQQEAAGMRPKAQKGGRALDEDRDTTNPALVTELFLGFLMAAGRSTTSSTIVKNTREEVLWNNARSPWRRSPLWMLLRVCLQLMFSRLPTVKNNRDLYKIFMVFLMSRILLQSQSPSPLQPQGSVSSDLLYLMNSKIARRLMKIGPAIDAKVHKVVMATLTHTMESLESQWARLQRGNQLDLTKLASLDFAKDSLFSLSTLDSYLHAIKSHHPGTDLEWFQPTSDLQDFSVNTLPNGQINQTSKYVAQNLCGFETWVSTHLSTWITQYKTDASTCTRLRAATEDYHRVAVIKYSGEPEATSIMVLTVMCLWMACDISAVALCPLLAQYKPALPIEFLQNLLLPFKTQMQQLQVVEAYLDTRSANARYPASKVFNDVKTHDCFAARFFDQSSKHQAIRDDILAQAETERSKKVAEFNRLKAEYNALWRLSREKSCNYYTVWIKDDFNEYVEEQRHSRKSCHRCQHEVQAEQMKIKIHEWPLPASTLAQKVVVFELEVPKFIASWRDNVTFVQHDVLQAKYPPAAKLRAEYRLSEDHKLSSAYIAHDTSRRIGLLSQEKPHSRTHRATHAVSSAVEGDVCLPSGLRYLYYDRESACFVQDIVLTDTISRACTYKLPKTSNALQKFIYRPAQQSNGQAPNLVIASQSDCPNHMTVHEYKALANIPCGNRIQWHNIALQLGFPAVDFKKVETALIILQCVYQAGPATGNTLRVGHSIGIDNDLAAKLLAELETALQRTKENWESLQALCLFTSIAARLLSLTSNIAVQEACLAFLAEARCIALRWIDELSDKAGKLETDIMRTEYLSKRAEIALICVDTFNVDVEHLALILTDVTQASTLLWCTIVVQENELILSKSSNPMTNFLRSRFERVLHRCYLMLIENEQALDNAIAKAWAGFQSTTGWVTVASEHWVMASSAVEGAKQEAIVHFNVLSGELLINSLPLARLPARYEAHPTYARLFGSTTIEVLPATAPGMEFTAKRIFAGQRIDFGMLAHESKNHLRIMSTESNNTLTLIPSELLGEEFPLAFRQKYIHWYDSLNNQLEFRPEEKPWDRLSRGAWILAKDESSSKWHLTKVDSDRSTLLCTKSGTARTVSRILSPLVSPTHVHAIYSPNLQHVEIDLPGVQLGFLLKKGHSELRSREFPRMFVDPDQTLKSLVGFQSMLVMKHAHGNRMVLVLDGAVSYGKNKEGTHISAVVPKEVRQNFHAYNVDERLGRLVDNGSVQSKLLLAYLHAITSYCLPDTLTCRTGTEQALSILSSAALKSFDRLTDENVSLLCKIAKLSPVRKYYPADMREMQTVQWSDRLGFLSQDAALYVSARSVIEQARITSSIFYRDATVELPEMNYSDAGLVQRCLSRCAFFRVSGYGAEDFTTVLDTTYTPRDCGQGSSRFSDAFGMSRFVFQQKQDLDSEIPADVVTSLWTALSRATTVQAKDRPLDLSRIGYDAALLSDPFEITVLPTWTGLIRNLRAQANKFSIMIFLSTLSFGSDTQYDSLLLQTLALCFTRDDISQIMPVPSSASYHLSLGVKFEAEEVRIAIKDLIVPLADSVDALLPKQSRETDSHYNDRRKTAYTIHSNTIVDAIRDHLSAQWPCHTPVQPDIEIANISSYVDMSKVMTVVLPKFATWHDNLELLGSLQRLQSVLSSMSVNAIDSPEWSTSTPLPRIQLTAKHVSIDDVFRTKAPQLPAHPASDHLKLSTDSQNGKSIDLRLTGLIKNLRSSAAQSKYENRYVDMLDDSARQLKDSMNAHDDNTDHIDQQSVENYLSYCKKHVEQIYLALLAATLPGVSPELDQVIPACTVKLWPRLSPTFFLQQLSRTRWCKLSKPWQGAIVQFGLALTALQRAERILKVLRSNSTVDLINEVRNIGHTWEPHDHPDSLLLEVESGIMIREVQEQIASHMRRPQNATNTVIQLNMGEGKSSLIIPIVAAALATGRQLVRVVVAKPQSAQMSQMMVSKLGGLLQRQVYYMPFSRALDPGRKEAESIRSLLEECKSSGGILLVQPEHILSFRLMALESLIEGRDEVAASLLSTQAFFDESSRDLIDESDENLSVRLEMIYTLGKQRLVDLSPQRWLCVGEVLGLVQRFSLHTADRYPGSLEISHRLPGRFPRTRILAKDAQDDLFMCVATHICENGLDGFPIARQPKEVRSAVLHYITSLELTPSEIAQVENTGPSGFWADSTKGILLLLRGLFANGVLSFALGQKRWRVNYGLDATRSRATKLAVPYRAKDNPSPRSEFSHPDAIILLTTLSYYYGGLEEADLSTAFDHLLKSDQAEVSYEAWVRDVDRMPIAYSLLQGINLQDNHQFVAELFPRFRYSKAVIDYFLANVIFPKEMKEFPSKLSASGWDLGKVKVLPTTGFSGTNDSRVVLPLHVNQLDLPAQSHTNALVLEYLLNPDNAVAHVPPAIGATTTDAERLLDMVMKLDPPAKVILDVGAQILELGNFEVARAWLAKHKEDVQAAIYVNEADELCVVNRKGQVEALQMSSLATQLDVCLVFLDEAHTRGIDLRLPETYRAAVTLGPNLVKDRLVQACMRMRKLGLGQTVVFCVPGEIRSRIIQQSGKPASASIEVADILAWSVTESWSEMRRSMPLWAVQGKRFVDQNEIWEEARTSGHISLSKRDGERFLEEEAQSVEDRYRPNDDPDGAALLSEFKSDNVALMQIKQRCLDFENLRFASAALQEEQERELSPEIEEEFHHEKPPQVKAQGHILHKDVETFVETGKLVKGSAAFHNAFMTLARTNAADHIKLVELSYGDGPDLRVTNDFAQTVKSGSKAAEAQFDNFLRPVQWVLTATLNSTVNTVVVISPFEAQELLPHIHGSSKVALHLYACRVNVGYRSLDRLDFIKIGGQPGSAPVRLHPRLTCQLNIFAGQLYFQSHDDFKYMCSYLGLATGTAEKGWKLAADGFILRDNNGKVGGPGSALTRSPISFLQALATMRRDGEGISKTDMGMLLEGRTLEPSRFYR